MKYVTFEGWIEQSRDLWFPWKNGKGGTILTEEILFEKGSPGEWMQWPPRKIKVTIEEVK